MKITLQLLALAFLTAFPAAQIHAQGQSDFGLRTYRGYVEKWRSMETYRYMLADRNGESIVYIGDDYPEDFGNPQKKAVRDCLNEAYANKYMVEITGQWIKMPEDSEGLDENTVTCRILSDSKKEKK